jgi:hypothetical protein
MTSLVHRTHRFLLLFLSLFLSPSVEMSCQEAKALAACQYYVIHVSGT